MFLKSHSEGKEMFLPEHENKTDLLKLLFFLNILPLKVKKLNFESPDKCFEFSDLLHLRLDASISLGAKLNL